MVLVFVGLLNRQAGGSKSDKNRGSCDVLFQFHIGLRKSIRDGQFVLANAGYAGFGTHNRLKYSITIRAAGIGSLIEIKKGALLPQA